MIQFAASVLENHSRADDAAARIGGEEFALLLVNTAEKDALAIAERIRLAVNAEQKPSAGANDHQYGVVYDAR